MNVVGGFSKMLKYFIEEHLEGTLVSYSNRFWSNGSVYKKNGFEYVGHSGVGYSWTNGKLLISRYSVQAKKLREKYGEIVSEKNFMENIMKMNKFYDAGNDIWILSK